MKILILGNARHGKDSLAELWNEYYGMTYLSSSEAALEIFLFNKLKDKYNYSTPQKCFEDRVNHRQEWYLSICDYNKDDKTRLAKGILEKSNCYVGMRDKEEFIACKERGLFDLIIWVDASKRLGDEPITSFNISKSDADIIIENNGSFEEFKEKSKKIGKVLFNI